MEPSPAFERGLEVVSGKNDTTRMTIAVLTWTSWILSKNPGIRKPKCGCVCVQVIYSEETQKKKKHIRTAIINCFVSSLPDWSSNPDS